MHNKVIRVFKVSEKQLLNSNINFEGVSAKHGRFTTLLTVAPLVDVLNAFASFKDSNSLLQLVYGELALAENQKRIAQLKEQISRSYQQNRLGLEINLTILVREGTIKPIGNSNVLRSIEYSKKDALLIGGLIQFVALMELMGWNYKKLDFVANQSELRTTSRLRSSLSTQSISCKFILDNDQPLEDNGIIKLLSSFNSNYSGLQSMVVSRISDESFVKDFVYELASEMELERFGGFSSRATRVTKSDGFVTTEATMLQVVLASVCGAKIKMSSESLAKLTDGTFSNEDSLRELKPFLVAFYKSWLDEATTQFLRNRDGFHYSTQIWQALALVVHELLRRECDLEKIAIYGQILGKLDYSKKASHWSNCKAMVLDTSGINYKNATNGGRSFRDAVARYFLELIDLD